MTFNLSEIKGIYVLSLAFLKLIISDSWFFALQHIKGAFKLLFEWKIITEETK